MKLESVRVRGYRSAADVELPKVGNFNVLIGKNNAGKSTILAAIRSFFRCIRDGVAVSLEPPIGQAIVDFYGGKDPEPMEIALRLLLAEAERGKLLESMAHEAPQLRNAVGALPTSLLLSISVRIVGPSNSFAHVRRVTLVPVNPAPEGPVTETVLLSVGELAAAELEEKYRRTLGLERKAQALRDFGSQFDEDDYRVAKSARAEGRPSRAYMYSRRLANVSPDVAEDIESLMRDTSSHSDFQNALRSTAEQMAEHARKERAVPLNNPVETFAGLQPAVPEFALEALRMAGGLRVLYLTEQRKQVGKEEAAHLLQLKMQRGGDSVLDNIKQTVQSLLGVTIDAFAGPSTSPFDRNAEMDVDNFLLEANGSGIREALRVVLDVEFQKPELLLVEEPEMHLHPALETSMMRFMKEISAGCQVFISTHSTNFLDTADTSNVYLISKLDGATSAQLVDLEEAATSVPKELGLRLSSLFMFERLVFVEGPTDEAVVREWAATLGVNLNQASVGFISMGGARNFTHYATESVFDFLTRRQINSWFILDRDERSEAEEQTLRERLGPRASVAILERREIENYLLSPSAIAKFINEKLRTAESSPPGEVSIEAVDNAMEESAKELRQRVIDKRVAWALCRPVYPQLDWEKKPERPIEERVASVATQLRQQAETIGDRAAKVVEEQSKVVGDSWDAEWRAMVPGDALLDLVCRKFATRFRKRADGPRIAALMSEEEIDPFMRGLVRGIVAPRP